METIRKICNELFPPETRQQHQRHETHWIEIDPIVQSGISAVAGRGELFFAGNGNAVMLHMTENNESIKGEVNSRPYLTNTWKFIPDDIIQQVLHCKTDSIEKKSISCQFEDGFTDKKMIIIIPLKGRTDNIRTVLQSFTKDSSIGVLVVEGDKSSTSIKDISIEEGCSYMHIEVDEFNKSQCMNIAYSVIHSETKADWFVFHDADVVLCSQFNKQLQERIKRDDLPKFFQCFSNKCVRYLEKNQSKLLRELVSKEGPISEQNYNSFIETARTLGHINTDPSPGAPGGSICIHRDLFESIGGYDPEWCLRYGPEDSMFLMKVNYFYDNASYHDKHGTCGVHRIETENLDCSGCHLWHPTATYGDVFIFATSILLQNVLIGLDKQEIKHMLKSASLQLDMMKSIYSKEG